jgi:1-acyl-sn-glycerol-3-phosphate acyltransferase
MSVALRSTLFAAVQILITPPFAFIALLTFPFDPLTRYRIITAWTRLLLHALALIVRHTLSRHREGKHPAHAVCGPCKASVRVGRARVSAHFSAACVGDQARVAMDSLFRLGTGDAVAHRDQTQFRNAGDEATARARPRASAERIVGDRISRRDAGCARARARYQTGGAAVAIHAHVPVLPVAHNAGTCWGRQAFLKYPGTITVSIGKPIDTHNKKADALTQEVEDWIEGEMQHLDNGKAHSVPA